MAGINNEALETLQQENKTLHKKARQMERRLAETDRLLSLMTTTAKNASQTLAFMEQEILQREKYLNMLLDNCKDFFILLNEKLEITYCSRNFTEVMRQRGFTKLRNQSYVDLLKCFVGTQHKQRSLERLEKLRSGKTVSETVEEIDFRGDGKPGKYTTFAASMYDDANHDFSGILICYSDVTDLVEAREAAEESVKAKAAFLARMSHEIRTPMNAIIGLSKLALRDELPPKARAYCGDVNSAANNLLGIINDILDFSKIESGKMEIVNAEYQFASLVNDVTTIIRMRLSDSAVNFVTDIARDIPGRLFGDEVRIRQILLNLLSNAVKYTREGEIRFSMKAEFGEAGKVTLIIDITDTGIGIKEEDLGKLFGNFTRFDMEKNKHVEGTGLGLAITLNLCRAMGGDINVLSEYGKGSTFTAIIPQRAEDFTPFTAIIDGGTGGVSEEDMIHFTAPAARILIVDDIETNLTVAEGLVSPYDVRVDTTLSGTEAISLMQQYEYDIVFMDHMMPEMDGLEATAIIRALDEPRFREVPIIALTANAMSGMREMFLEQGFNDYLSKPIEIPKLDEIMSRWIPREKQIK
ncbi:MAG: response regulator, partial [Treponema sp.]|nr:response regulator [Treponema sp.]